MGWSPYLVTVTLLLLVEIIAVTVLDSITISVRHEWKGGGWWWKWGRLIIARQWGAVLILS